MGIFSKKSGSVTHNYIWAPNTMLSEKTNEPNLTEGQTEGRMDGPYFMGPFWPRTGLKKNGMFLSVGFTVGKLFEIVYSRKKNYNATPTIPYMTLSQEIK